MKRRDWIVVLSAYFVTVIGLSALVYIMGHIVLRMPLLYVGLVAGLCLVAVAVGFIITIRSVHGSHNESGGRPR